MVPRPSRALASLVPGAPTLLPAPDELRVDWLGAEPHAITGLASTRRASAACPRCARRARQVHSHYMRSLADLPWQGGAVRLRLRPRRFCCDAPACPQPIVTERLPATAAPYARQTARLDATLRLLGAALGGAAGERLARARSTRPAGARHR